MKQKTSQKRGSKSNVCSTQTASGGAVYGLGMIGAAIYFIQTATSFWDGVWGLVKAFFWPAFGLYEVFRYIGA